MAGKRTTQHDPASHLREASARWGGTSYKNAPTKSVSVGGTRFVYRELGIDTGVPVIFGMDMTGNYGGLSWTSGYATIQDLQRAGETLNSNPDFAAFLDKSITTCYQPQATQTVFRRIATASAVGQRPEQPS